jgi:hypothetical protein
MERISFPTLPPALSEEWWFSIAGPTSDEPLRKTMRENVNNKFTGHTVKHAWQLDIPAIG